MPSTNVQAAMNALRVLNLDELNEILPFYKNLLSLNRKIEASTAVMDFAPGDEVVLHNIRPKHMNGSKGTVVSVKQTRVVVKFPGTAWAMGVTVPATCLTKTNVATSFDIAMANASGR
jgi:hypothetical protein